jgi:hypothetical protein
MAFIYNAEVDFRKIFFSTSFLSLGVTSAMRSTGSYYLLTTLHGVITPKGHNMKCRVNFCLIPVLSGRCSSVIIVTGLRAGRPGFGLGRGKRFFTPPQHPSRLWDPPSLLSTAYRRLKLTTHLRLVPMLRVLELHLHSPICL